MYYNVWYLSSLLYTANSNNLSNQESCLLSHAAVNCFSFTCVWLTVCLMYFNQCPGEAHEGNAALLCQQVGRGGALIRIHFSGAFPLLAVRLLLQGEASRFESRWWHRHYGAHRIEVGKIVIWSVYSWFSSWHCVWIIVRCHCTQFDMFAEFVLALRCSIMRLILSCL